MTRNKKAKAEDGLTARVTSRASYDVCPGLKVCGEAGEVQIAFSRGSGGRLLLNGKEVRALAKALNHLVQTQTFEYEMYHEVEFAE